jgi:phosphoglycolate phosphatase-like HAD superfamily hydrolase
MRMLALDFDGVIVDSGREVFYTALNTYVGMHPNSSWRRLLDRIGDLSGALEFDWQASDDFLAFQDLVPLGNRAEDFGVALRIIEAGAGVRDQKSYDDYYRSIDGQWRQDFHEALYRTRNGLRSRHESAWLALHDVYGPLVRLLRRHAASVPYAIATAKDRISVERLLLHHGLVDMFEDRYIYDKEAGMQKTDHLQQLSSDCGVPLRAITFVDDKVNHLVAVSPLNVRCILAGWGCNSRREWQEARAHGFPVATLDSADRVLFSG